MTRLSLFALIVAIMLSACDQKESQDKLSLMEASKQELATALGERDELLALMTEISTATDQIRHLENILTEVDGKSPVNSRQKAHILAEIQLIGQTLQQRREQLAVLEQKTQKSNLYNSELQKSIDVLKKQLESRTLEINRLKTKLNSANEQIEILSTQVDSLNSTVETVNRELTASHDASMRLANELNTCYYTVASKSDLKNHKILETGFLKKSRLLKGEFDKEFFVIGDKRTLTTIDVHSFKAKILSNHPQESYEIIDSNGSPTLKIIAPDKFWDRSNYLVVQID